MLEKANQARQAEREADEEKESCSGKRMNGVSLIDFAVPTFSTLLNIAIFKKLLMTRNFGVKLGGFIKLS